jgi:hypothetical protein
MTNFFQSIMSLSIFFNFSGIRMSWNQTIQQWLPDEEIDLAIYSATYGVPYDYVSMPKPEPRKELPTKNEENKQKEPPRKLTKEEKLVFFILGYLIFIYLF